MKTLTLALALSLSAITAISQDITSSKSAIGNTQLGASHYPQTSGMTMQKTAKPWTFWYWMYGCVSDEGIRQDLQAMKDAGIAGFYLMPIKDTADGPQYGGTARQLGDEWWDRMHAVFRVADSLGLEAGIHFCDGFALGGGPWITPEESMQKVVWTDTIVEGGKAPIAIPHPTAPSGYYEDIATYAYLLSQYEESATPHCNVEFPFRSNDPCEILFSYDKPFTLKSLRIITGGNNYQAHRWRLFASDDGTNYRHVRDIEPARQGWQNTDAFATYSIPATTASHFKFCWTPEGSDPGSEDMDAAKWKPVLKVAEIQLSSQAVIDGYEGKSGAVWRVSKSFPLAQDDCIRLDESAMQNPSDIKASYPTTPNTLTIVPLTPDGTVTLPKGRWRVLRMGHTSTGHTNATGGGGRGLECDKFSRDAIRKQMEQWFGRIYSAAQTSRHNVVKRLHVDSWECGSQNWSRGFASEFQWRRGYSIIPWLPLYAGVPMESSDKSDMVLRDIRLTIAELIDEVFFDEMEQAARRYGVSLSAECVAPTMVSDGLVHYRHTDYPMGEFWLNSPTHDKPNDMLDAISGAHLYGKNIIQAEGFTEVRGTWDETPAMLKPLLDRNYCLGINSIVFHVFTHNPWTDRRPGMTLDGIGTFFQRDNTWWREMPAFTSYITNCQNLLQYGRPVVDIAVYAGDEVPRRAILPERLTTILPGLMGDSLLQREAKRLKNEGQPMETSPVGVSHTLNMTKATDWTNPLHGYKYDTFTHDALNGMTVSDGTVMTASGMCYSAIVVAPSRKMNPDGINTGTAQIEQLRRKGAIVMEQPWTNSDLTTAGIPRDVTLPEGVDFTHRQGNEADIYFFSNQNDCGVTFNPQCRERRACRYLYDPISNIFTSATDSVTLEAGGSAFLILSDSPNPPLLRHAIYKDDATGVFSPLPANGKTTTIDNGWQITFEETGKTIENATLDKGWQDYDDPGIKYYSGHASYENTFRHKGKGDVWIDLGETNDIATVYVNGICCGTAWTLPHRLNITHAVKRGTNTLRIEVANTWANALLGSDKGTPPYDGIWTNGKYRLSGGNPLPAGMKGPVNIIAIHPKK